MLLHLHGNSQPLLARLVVDLVHPLHGPRQHLDCNGALAGQAGLQCQQVYVHNGSCGDELFDNATDFVAEMIQRFLYMFISGVAVKNNTQHKLVYLVKCTTVF